MPSALDILTVSLDIDRIELLPLRYNWDRPFGGLGWCRRMGERKAPILVSFLPCMEAMSTWHPELIFG